MTRLPPRSVLWVRRPVKALRSTKASRLRVALCWRRARRRAEPALEARRRAAVVVGKAWSCAAKRRWLFLGLDLCLDHHHQARSSHPAATIETSTGSLPYYYLL